MLIQLKSWKSWLAALYALPAIYAQSGDYFSPNSTGIKFQNGFERVYIQVCTSRKAYSMEFDTNHSPLVITDFEFVPAFYEIQQEEKSPRYWILR
jgi:hypothetical protein